MSEIINIVKIIEILIMFLFSLPSLFLFICNLFNFKLSKNLKTRRAKALIFIFSVSSLFVLVLSVIVVDSDTLYHSMRFAAFQHIFIIFLSCIKTYTTMFSILSMAIVIHIIFIKLSINTSKKYVRANKNILHLHFSFLEKLIYFNLWLETKVFIKQYNDDILISELAYNEFCEKRVKE